MKPVIEVRTGSDSDMPKIADVYTTLSRLSVAYSPRVLSAHRTPSVMQEEAQSLLENGFKVCIGAAGGSAHLPGMTASETLVPVVALPVRTSHLQGVDSLYSMVQMPPGIPVGCVGIGQANNAALAAAQIVALQDPTLRKKICEHRGIDSSHVPEKATPLVGIFAASKEDAQLNACATMLEELKIPYEASELSEKSVEQMRELSSRGAMACILLVPLGELAKMRQLVGAVDVPMLIVPLAADDEHADIAEAMQEDIGPALYLGIERAANAALLAGQIIGVHEREVLARITVYRQALRTEVRKRDTFLQNVGAKTYLKHMEQGNVQELSEQQQTTYKDAGVDIDAGNDAVTQMKAYVKSTFNEHVLSDIGLFGGLYKLDGFDDPVLVSSSDSVGTKVRIAAVQHQYDTIGQDLVNHCVNDILVQGAKPLFFLDYIAASSLKPKMVAEIVKGITIACKENNCALIGGETAELPGVYKKGEFDVVSCIVGAVEQQEILDGTRIKEGDVLIGLPSSGIHTNGYSLVIRTLLDDTGLALDKDPGDLGRTLGEELLAIHKSYVAPVHALLSENLISGLAHITGGGLIENVPRILPKGTCARIEKATWSVPPIFSLIQKHGNIAEDEMYRVFNMGIGFVLVVPKEYAKRAASLLKENGEEPVVIGDVGSGEGVVFT